MSLSVAPLEVCRVIDPVVSGDFPRKYLITGGAKNISQTVLPASSSTSTTSVVYSYQPNPQFITSRKIYQTWPMQFVFTGSDQGSPLIAIGTNDSLRSFPICVGMNTIQASLNSNSVSLNSYDVMQPLLRYSGEFNLFRHDLSLTPSQLDQFQQYSDYITLGTARNVLKK